MISGWNFDWDDNIFYMPTTVVLYRQNTHERRAISTGEFATVRQQLGTPGPWEDYEVRSGSFQYFRDGEHGENFFLSDLKKAIASNVPSWIGPSWDAFRFALTRQQTAEHTTIITARGHSPAMMIEGLKFLHMRGYIRHLPPIESLFPVSHPDFAGTAANPAAVKAQCMIEILDKLSALPIADDAPLVLDREGKHSMKAHLWGFSDDDRANYEKALNVLKQHVTQGRWSNVKISVFYTGIHDPQHEPSQKVIQGDGSVRVQLPMELYEGEITALGGSAFATDPTDPAHHLATTAPLLWKSGLRK